MAKRRNSLLAAALRLPVALLVVVIRLYQRAFAPVLPALLGPQCRCGYAPSCSQYAAEALQRHGLVAGGWLAVRRLARCTPFHRGGFDPVPRRPARRGPQCARASA
jgi:hypothetical protein